MRIRTLVIPAGGFALPACGGRVARTRSTSRRGRAGPRSAAGACAGRARRHGCRQSIPHPPQLVSRRTTAGIVD